MRSDVARLRGLYAITSYHHRKLAGPPQAFPGSLGGDRREAVISGGAHLLAAALKGGVRLVQYRNKSPDRTQAAELLDLCRGFGAKLIVNDSVALATDIGADGVHLGRHDPYYAALPQARALLGPDRFLGVSCYNDLNLAQVAVDAGADYIALGCVFSSLTKPDADRVSLATLKEARQRFSLPIVAIGGITLENAPDVISTGVDALAVSTGLFGAPNVQAYAEKFQRLFKDDES